MVKKLYCIFILLILVACQQANINVEQGSYVHEGDNISKLATLELKENHGKSCFELSPAAMSSTIYRGEYKIDGDQLILHDDEKNIDIYFTIHQNKLIFYGSSKNEIKYLNQESQFVLLK